ncbi:MAG: DUF1963 domain-containing protein [Paracoccaceae bacterium]
MTALPAAKTRTALPVMLIGQLVFACGLAVEEPWISFLGITLFIGTHALGNALRGGLPDRPAPPVLPERPARQTAPNATRRPRPPALPVPSSGRPRRPAAWTGSLGGSACLNAPVLLRPIVPLDAGARSDGWFGGDACLPESTDWPLIDGKPALFLAQIDCSRLPKTLWNGAGPRDGWLLFFRSQSRPARPLILHTASKGEPRQPPAPPPLPGPPMREDLLEKITGRPSSPPRWPVELISAASGQAAGCAAPGQPATRLTPDPDTLPLSDPRLQPFDWPSAMILIEVILTELDWQRRVVSTLAGPEAEQARLCAFLDTVGSAAETVGALKSALESARDEGLPFDDRLRGLILEGLGRLRIDSGLASGQAEADPDLQPLLDHDQIRRDWVRWLDRYALRLYSERPDALPATQRTLFETLWSWRAHHECAGLGGTAPDGLAPPSGADTPPVPIIALPSSALMGWQFGDRGTIAAFLDASALAQGDFSGTFGEVLT